MQRLSPYSICKTTTCHVLLGNSRLPPHLFMCKGHLSEATQCYPACGCAADHVLEIMLPLQSLILSDILCSE